MRTLIATLMMLIFAGSAAQSEIVKTEHYDLRLTTIAAGLSYPWGMTFLPDKAMIVTERPGAIRIISPDGHVSAPLLGLPAVYASGQGGLLDVALDPNFSSNQRIYISYAEPGAGGAGTAVASAILDRPGNALRDLKVIFRQTPKTDGGRHFGSRLVFSGDGTLFITVGERGERERAQDFTINRGQVVRINSDGAIPPDNPFIGKPGYRPEVWSYGHRNPQGAALHPQSGDLWTVEHGARGGDEINIPKAGGNYGWPVIAYGRHYSGGKIGVGTHAEGMEQPLYYWDPSIAPSGMMFYTGDKFPRWKGSLMIGALSFRLLTRLSLKGNTITDEERMLQNLEERIRDVRQGPDGYIYILTDSGNGRIIRLEPAKN
jgi:aldose sugar dehydrogenase